MRRELAPLMRSLKDAAEKWNRNPETFYTKNEDGETLLDALKKAHPELTIVFNGTNMYGFRRNFIITRKAARSLSVEGRIEISVNFTHGDGPVKKRPEINIKF